MGRQQARKCLEFADFTRYSFRSSGDFTTIADELHSSVSTAGSPASRFPAGGPQHAQPLVVFDVPRSRPVP
ncbi:hypothetical protein [Streptomyces sp. NBC_01013]|uniref:hypothetical protein n=1 Tax=Streptomyces sp. NBC_01013 TaxID=2903718 RepID=UPI00386B8469|nr:hypothetical protein OG538_35415 [Streptomyces sp. NBC_01013]